MIRVIFLFVVLTALVWAGILGVQKLSGSQALNLTKALAYAIISASVAMILMFGLVILF